MKLVSKVTAFQGLAAMHNTVLFYIIAINQGGYNNIWYTRK